MAVGEVGLLRRAIGLCSRSAVAYKAAYMLTLEQGAEKALLERCTARYALLERLLGLLVERSTPPSQVRDLLDGIDMDPARYQGRLDRALADACHGDDGLAALIAAALDEGELSAAVEVCLRDQALPIDALAAAPPAEAVAAGTVARVEASGSLRSAPPTA
jgi:hypothetical protein